MNEFDENKILKIKTGSHLYGTNTELSDTDYSGIFIADEDYYFGLKRVDEQDLSIADKNESGKNTKDALDYKLYEIRNFARLALQNNPNIIEFLFVNDENIEFVDDLGIELLNNAHLFPYKGAKERFIGYASSQKHKMVIKKEHFGELVLAYDFFKNELPNQYLLSYSGNKNTEKFMSEDTVHFIIGDLSFQKHLLVKKVLSVLTERMDKITNRTELILKYGYDTKFGSHLIRLLMEGEELLLTGRINFPLQYASMLLDIKLGKYTLNETLEMATQVENRINDAEKKSALPSKPRFNEVNSLIKNITKSFYKRSMWK